MSNTATIWSLASRACFVAGGVAALLFACEACGTSATTDPERAAGALPDAAVESQDGAVSPLDGGTSDARADAEVCTPIKPARIPGASFSFRRAMVNATTGGYVVLGGSEVVMLDANGKLLGSGTNGTYYGRNETVTGVGYSPVANEYALAIAGDSAAIDHFDANGLFNSRSIAPAAGVYSSRMVFLGKMGVLAYSQGSALRVAVEDGKGGMTASQSFATNQLINNFEISLHPASQNVAVAWLSRASAENNDTFHVLVRTPAGATPFAEFTAQATGINNEGLAITAVDDGWIVLWQSSSAGATSSAHLATNGSLIKRGQADLLGPDARPSSVILTHELGRTLLSYHSMDYSTMFTREVNDAAMTVGPERTMMQTTSMLTSDGSPTAIASPGGGITILWGIAETVAFGRVCN